MPQDARIAIIKARIAEREGKPGYKRNVEALKAELAKLAAVPAEQPTQAAQPDSRSVVPKNPAKGDTA